MKRSPSGFGNYELLHKKSLNEEQHNISINNYLILIINY